MFQIPNKVEGNTYNTEEFNKGVREELQTFVTDSGQSFNPNDPTQMVQAVNRIAFNRTTLKEAVGSSGAAYQLETVVASVEALKVLENGSVFYFKATNANTTTTPTIIINTLDPLPSPIPLRNQDGTTLYIGQLQAGDIVTVYYNEDDGRCEIIDDSGILNTTRDVNFSNFHNVVSFTPTGNVYLLQSPGGSQSIYQGYIIRFKATDTITGATHISLSETTSVNIPLRKNGRELVAGDIKAGDVITATAPGDGTFQIISQTFQSWLNTENQLVSKDLNGNFGIVYNHNRVGGAGGGTYQIVETDNKKNFFISNINNPTTIVLPSKTETWAPDFEMRVIFYEPYQPVTFQAPSGEVFQRDGLNQSSYTLRQYGSNSNITLIITYFGPSQGFIITGLDGADRDNQGAGRIANQNDVDTGTDDRRWVTPKTFHQGLINAGYINIKDNNPIGTIREFGNDFNPNSDPAFSSGGMVWTEINAGYVSQTTNTPGQAGTYAGANSFQSGSTNGHTLTIAQIPPHAHPIPNTGNIREGNSDQGQVRPVSTQKNPLNTLEVGGGQAHSHVLDGKVFYVRKWMRTT